MTEQGVGAAGLVGVGRVLVVVVLLGRRLFALSRAGRRGTGEGGGRPYQREVARQGRQGTREPDDRAPPAGRPVPGSPVVRSCRCHCPCVPLTTWCHVLSSYRVHRAESSPHGARLHITSTFRLTL